MSNTELAGIRFFTDNSNSVEPWFFYREGDVDVLPFYNPDILTRPFRGALSIGPNLDLLNQASYVLSGRQGGERAIIDAWVQTGGAQRADIIYTNGNNFTIYKNKLK